MLDDIQQIVFGTHDPSDVLWRPSLQHCFSVWIDPAFGDSTPMILAALDEWVGATDGDVGFIHDARPEHDIRIVLDGARPGVDGVPGEYCGLAYVEGSGGVIRGGEVVIHPLYVQPKVILHELGHVGLGMSDCELRHSVMGGLAIDAARVPDIDRAAWRWMRDREPGSARPGAASGARAQSVRARAFVDLAPNERRGR